MDKISISIEDEDENYQIDRKEINTEIEEEEDFDDSNQGAPMGGGLLKRFRKQATMVLSEEQRATMNESDENGWAHIHHAAHIGFVKSVERFIRADSQQIELETSDGFKSTPLLLAVMSENQDIVMRLVELGANIRKFNSKQMGVIELALLKKNVDVLKYFISLNDRELPVWKHLINALTSEVDFQCESAVSCIRILIEFYNSNDENKDKLQDALKNRLIPALIKLLQSDIEDIVKEEAYKIINLLINDEKVILELFANDGVNVVIEHLKPQNSFLAQQALICLKNICSFPKYAERTVQQNNIIPVIFTALQKYSDISVLTECITTLGNIARDNKCHQDMICSEADAVRIMVNQFDRSEKQYTSILLNTINEICNMNIQNQNLFVNEGIALRLIPLIQGKNKDSQIQAVETIICLTLNNMNSQSAFISDGAVSSLLNLLKKSKQTMYVEKTASALWNLAGEDFEQKRVIADLIDVQILIEFLSSSSETLHHIGSEGLNSLANGPKSRSIEIGNANGIQSLIRLCRNSNENITLSVIKTLRSLCVGIGYVPVKANQSKLAKLSQGIPFLVSMMNKTDNQLIQVQAAYTLACFSLGEAKYIHQVCEGEPFNYSTILKLLSSDSMEVRILAGAALATFAYNNIRNQDNIARQGGVKFSCFIPFLNSEDENLKCQSAFQVVILARLFPDERQAISSAAGIQTLADILSSSTNNEILTLAANCIARLAHTRAGIVQAFIAINTISLLCDLMHSSSESLKGSVSIALGYLTQNPEGTRLMLNRCRLDPFIMKVLQKYQNREELSESLMEGWKHYRKIGLPKTPAVSKEKDKLQALFSINELQRKQSGTRSECNSIMMNSPRNLHTGMGYSKSIYSPSLIGEYGRDKLQGSHSEMSHNSRLTLKS